MLPSQSARAAGGSRGGAYGRRRRRKGPLGLPLPGALVAIALLVGAGWLLVSWWGSPREADAGQSGEARTLATATPSRESASPIASPITSPTERPARLDPPVETLTQGRTPNTSNQSPAPALQSPNPSPSSSPNQTPSGQPGTRNAPSPAPSQAQNPSPSSSTPTIPAPSARPPAPSGSSVTSEQALAEAERLVRANRPVEARQVLNDALLRTGRHGPGAAALRQRLGALSEDITFSPRVYDADPYAMTYEVQPGDSLARIASRMGLAVDWRLIQRVNRITDPRRIRVGQKLKLVRGPFHAVVHKSEYRADIYAGPPEAESEWVFIRSFTVGLGEGDSTPVGEFVVRQDSKLINPHWVNPRTGERFHADDPLNPIGEHWIGIEGVGPYAVHTGYGLHGTIEPESMGQQRSMGCVRLLPDDIELVYELLAEGISRVVILP